jgi:repressor LexA
MYLTKRQKEIYDYIKDYIDKNGYSPSLKELAENCGSMSTAGVFNHINALIKKGLIKKTPYRTRALELIERQAEKEPIKTEVPVLGIIANGFPSRTQTPLKFIRINDEMSHGPHTYALKVIGDYLKPEYILDGDYIVVESKEQAGNGELTLVVTNDGNTALFKIYNEDDKYIIRSLSQAPNNTSIIEANKIKILGSVVGVIRNLK